MDINNLKGLMEAYQQVHAPEQLDEMGQPKDKAAYDAQVSKNRAALGNTLLYGNAAGKKPEKPLTRNKNLRGGRTVKPATPAAKPAAATPTPKPAAATPTPKPAAATPTPKPATPAAKPSAAKVAPAAKPEKPAPGTKAAGPESIKPKTPNPLMQKTFGYQKGQAPDQIAKVKSATDTAAKNLSGTGALKKEELDIFDVVLEFLQAKGFAKTLEEAEWLMANKLDSEDIANIIDEAVKGESSDRRRALAAERRKGIKPLSTKEGEKYASHKISQMAHSRRAKMGDED